MIEKLLEDMDAFMRTFQQLTDTEAKHKEKDSTEIGYTLFVLRRKLKRRRKLPYLGSQVSYHIKVINKTATNA